MQRPRPAAPPASRRRQAALALGRFVEARTQGLLDRLLRGRLWVGFVGALLAGIVFLNVSLLQLNQDIARTTARVTVLDRQNASLRNRLSALDSSELIQRLARAQGMTMPAPGQYRYLRAHPWLDSERAARAELAAAPATPTATTSPPVAPQPAVPASTAGAQATEAPTAPGATTGLTAPAATAGTP